MPSMLSTGVSGLLSMQTALDTTSHNISNASTAGYTRQGVLLTENQPQYSGGNWVGTGVSVSSIQRFYDDLVATQVRTASSSKSQWEVYSTLSDQINNLFGDAKTGMAGTLQDFANAFQSVANSPGTTAERQVLLSKAQTLVNQLQTYGVRLNQLDAQSNLQLSSEADTVTQLAASIASLNTKISAASIGLNHAPNDLLDQRDRLIDELSTHVTVSTVKQDDGQVNVFVGNGQSLVLGANASKISAITDSFDPTHKTLVISAATGGGAAVDISQNLTGGTLGGLIDFRDELLTPSLNNLGQVAVAVSSLMNSQQRSGLDLNGVLGTDLFSLGGVGVLQNKANTGTATLNATRSDVTALTADDYLLARTATGWSMQNSLTGQSVSMTGTGTAVDPFIADGVSVVVSGVANAGDKFLIQPTRFAVSGMSVLIKDPKAIAAAAPILATVSAANTGRASITQGEVVNAGDPNLQTPTVIEFLSPSTYTTDAGVTVNTYTSGQDISLNGWLVKITGTPAMGDKFNVTSNTNGRGDNRNALLMANALNKGYLNGGATTVNGAVSTWVADIGVRSNQAQANVTTQSAVYDDALNAQQSVSGVNLDEEAANLVRYQQAYSAMTKVISTSNEMFRTLMQAFN